MGHKRKENKEMTDYKKAWNRFKKEITKNDDKFNLKGCMYMTSQQIANHTATINLGGVARVNGKEKGAEILKTEAYKKLAEEIGITRVSYEVKENAYYCPCTYMRFDYK